MKKVMGLFWVIFCASLPAGAIQTKAIAGESKAKMDLATGDAHLRVEGAKFRAFNLLFLPTALGQKIENGQKMMASEIRQIIERDLNIAGGFSFVPMSNIAHQNDHALLKQKGVEGKTALELDFSGASIKAVVTHDNFITGRRKSAKFLGGVKELRRLSHHIAQSIFEEFIGPESLFTLQIAAVKSGPKESQIVLMDFDGQNEQVISSGPSIKASPSFSSNGKNILYTEITPSGQRIVEQVIGTKTLTERTKRKGLNIEPRVLPDESGMLATLSFQGQAAIYHLKRDGSNPTLLTESLGLNLSPSLSADGKLMVFVSSRPSAPHIYEQEFAIGKKVIAKRLTHKGNYNQTPQYNPDASLIVFTGRDENNIFDIFLIERSSGRISRVTENQGRNQEPYFSSSGRYVFFISEREGIKEPSLFLADLTGHQVRLTSAGSYSTPVVRPKS